MQPIKYIVTWSGGIDSTYTLAKLLKETDYRIHAHHIHFINAEGRAGAELKAIRALHPKLKAIRNFALSESAVDHRQYQRIPFDMAVNCFEVGALQKDLTYRGMPADKWTIGTHKAEGHNWERWEVIKHGVTAAAWPCKEPEFELQPTVTKQEEMEYLQSLGLLDDCWYCRVPVHKDGNFKPCGKCKTCEEVKNGNDTGTKAA